MRTWHRCRRHSQEISKLSGGKKGLRALMAYAVSKLRGFPRRISSSSSAMAKAKATSEAAPPVHTGTRLLTEPTTFFQSLSSRRTNIDSHVKRLVDLIGNRSLRYLCTRHWYLTTVLTIHQCLTLFTRGGMHLRRFLV